MRKGRLVRRPFRMSTMLLRSLDRDKIVLVFLDSTTGIVLCRLQISVFLVLYASVRTIR